MPRRRQAPTLLTELAHWDGRLQGVRAHVLLDERHSLPCVVTRDAATALAAKPHLTERECFRVVKNHASRIAAIASAKLAAAGGRRAEVVVDAADVNIA
jgi:hypothetical protein